MIRDKLKNFFFKRENEGNEKKKVENLMVFILILITTIIAINGIFGSKKNSKDKMLNQNKKLVKMEKERNEKYDKNYEDDEIRLSRNLELILSKIKGVRKSKCFNHVFSRESKNTNV